MEKRFTEYEKLRLKCKIIIKNHGMSLRGNEKLNKVPCNNVKEHTAVSKNQEYDLLIYKAKSEDE